MILIITSEAGDYSHPKIIDWLIYRNADYLIITGEEIAKNKNILTIKEDCIFYGSRNLTNEVTCVYYRRWFMSEDLCITSDYNFNQTLITNIQNETREIRNFLFYNLNDALWIPNLASLNVNKLEVLDKAKAIGLNVPDYIVTNNKIELIEFYNKNNKDIISKAIGNFTKVFTDDNIIVNPIYTKPITKELIELLPTLFFVSFFQKRIEKILELRIFYFNKLLFPIGVMSQETELTKLDSRKNNEMNESKLIMIDIPEKLRNQINDLMFSLNLNIGSLDFILGTDDLYYFLEVNPVGQLGGYSKRTSYNIEKKIVDFLINYDEQHTNNR